MEELDALLEKLINPESDDDVSGVYDEIRTLFTESVDSRDATIADHEAAADVSGETISALEKQLLETKAANFDMIMKAARDTGNVDPDLPDDVDDEFDSDVELNIDDYFDSEDEN